MLRQLKAILTLFFALSILPAISQECDTIIKSKDTADVQYFYNNIDSLALGRLHRLNMSLNGFQLYNPLYERDPFYAFLGNIGLANTRIDYVPKMRSEFSFGIHAFDKYRYTNENTEYYRTNDPYTELYYVQGSKKEQMLKIKFHRRIIGNFSLGIDARFINSPGFYTRQKADNKNLVINGQWYTNNRRYGILVNYIHNKVYVQENGGISDDALFENNAETNRENFPVNLYGAENQTKDNSFFINQYFNLSKPRQSRTGKNLGRLTYSFHQFKQTQKYIDDNPASGFYENIYLDSTSTLDSVYYYRVENQLTWSNLEYDDTLLHRPFYVYLGARHRYIELSGYMPKEYFRQITTTGGLRWSFNKFYHLAANANYTFGDYNGDDYHGRITLGRWFGNDSVNKGEIAVIAEISRQAPEYFYQQYHSNNFIWNNNFGKQGYLMTQVYYRWRRFNIGVCYFQLHNYVALNSDATPFQFDGSFNILRAYLYKDFKINKFNLIGKLVYQNASNTDVIRLPDLLTFVTFIFTTPIFGGAATIQPGIDFFYSTSYYADAYMPALRSFNLQQEKMIGEYPFVDIYFMIRIKRAKLFLKYQNLSGLFGNYTYYTVPHYPMNDPSFKFGVSWKFFD